MGESDDYLGLEDAKGADPLQLIAFGAGANLAQPKSCCLRGKRFAYASEEVFNKTQRGGGTGRHH